MTTAIAGRQVSGVPSAGQVLRVDGSGILSPAYPGRLDVDLSTAWDATTDATGPGQWSASAGAGALSDWDTLGFSGGQLVASISGAGSAATANLDLDLDALGYASMMHQRIASIIATITTAALGGAVNAAWRLMLRHASSSDEYAILGTYWDGAVRQLLSECRRNGAAATAQTVVDSSWSSADNRYQLDRHPTGQTVHRQTSAHVEISPSDIVMDGWARDEPMILRVQFTAPAGADVDVSISDLSLGGLV